MFRRTGASNFVSESKWAMWWSRTAISLFNALFIPNPTALEIRQLKNAAMAVVEKGVQVQ